MPNDQELIVEPINEEETVETPENPPEPKVEKPTETPEAKVARLQRQLKQAQKHAGIVEEPQVKQTNDPQLSDELKLIARGLSDEEIEQAKVIAKGKNVPLTEAVKDPLFLVYQDDLKAKEKKEKAKLGASKGSGETQEEVTGLQYGSTREEHEKAFKKLVGK